MPGFLRRHPLLARLLLLPALLILLIGYLAYVNRSAQARAREACAAAVPGQSLAGFRAAMRAQGAAYSEVMLHPGEPLLMVTFPALFAERYVCVVSGRGEEISGAEVNHVN